MRNGVSALPLCTPQSNTPIRKRGENAIRRRVRNQSVAPSGWNTMRPRVLNSNPGCWGGQVHRQDPCGGPNSIKCRPKSAWKAENAHFFQKTVVKPSNFRAAIGLKSDENTTIRSTIRSNLTFSTSLDQTTSSVSPKMKSEHLP